MINYTKQAIVFHNKRENMHLTRSLNFNLKLIIHFLPEDWRLLLNIQLLFLEITHWSHNTISILKGTSKQKMIRIASILLPFQPISSLNMFSSYESTEVWTINLSSLTLDYFLKYVRMYQGFLSYLSTTISPTTS